MKKTIVLGMLLLGMLLFSINIVASETFAQEVIVDFKKTCSNNGSACTVTADCNITIKYPNSTFVVEAGNMTNNLDGIFNYTIASNLMVILGTYNWDMFCCDTTGCNNAHGTFLVTKTGVELSQEKALIYLGLLALLIFLFLIDIGAIAFLPSSNTKDEEGFIIGMSNLKYLRIVFCAMAWGLLLAIMFTSSNIAFLYLESTMMGNLLLTLWKAMMLLSLPIVVVFFIWIIASLAQDKEIKNMIERGVPVKGKQ